jgi:hypothetical protein
VLAFVASFVVFGVMCGGLAGDGDTHGTYAEHPCFSFVLPQTSSAITPVLSKPLSAVSWLVVALLSATLASLAANGNRLNRYPLPLKVIPLQRRLASLQTFLQ